MARGKRGSRVADLYASRQQAVMPADEEAEVVAAAEPEEEPEEEIEVVAAEEPGEDDEPEEEPEEDESDPEAALTTMERQLAAITQERDQLRERAATAEVDTAVSHVAVLKQALGNAERGVTAAEAAIAAASAKGDYIAVAKATVALNRALLDVDKFTLAADEMEAEAKTRAKAVKTGGKPAPSADPYVDSIQQFTAESKRWLVQHRASLEGNIKAGQKAMALAQLALVDGVEQDSPEFFRRLNEGMGFVETKGKPRPKPTPGRKQSSAPAGARGGSATRQEVTLTRAQRDAAQQMGMSAAAYAKNLLELQKNAKDPSRGGLQLSAHSPHVTRGR
jgi:hypothetical protein